LLLELNISNIAIIESLALQFGSGFNVLTGETGAGKSIIIDAVNLLLGGRASTELIRTGCDVAAVEGVFALSPQVLETLKTDLADYDLFDESGELILRREISRGKRNTCRINGRTVPLGVLERVGHHLIDIHGQGDHLSLLQVRRHVDYLDSFGGLWPQRQEFAALVGQLQGIRRELRSLRQDERELARRIDLLTYQVEEIDAAKLQPDEEAALDRERRLLANAEKIQRLAVEAYEYLAGGEKARQPILDLLGEVASNLGELSRLDDSLKEQCEVVENALYQLEDVARTMRSYREGVEFDPQRLDAIEERVDLLHSLQRKYGDSIADVLAYAEKARAELARISHSGERIEELEAAERQLLQEIAGAGSRLSEARRRAAAELSAEIEAHLDELNMKDARFAVDMHWDEGADGAEVDGVRYAFDAQGFDRVEFLIAPNPGEEPKPLVKIASGGETSRIMLAMKNTLSAIDTVPTLIFDEIDTGVGGRTGDIVGHKLATLAQTHQVFCVTHLAQMACYGDKHFRVSKQVIDGRTISRVQELSAAERVEELAVMLGGNLTDATRQSAAEMLQRVSGARVA
jgi:DNA repair protein RecN (Recombination protein N)